LSLQKKKKTNQTHFKNKIIKNINIIYINYFLIHQTQWAAVPAEPPPAPARASTAAPATTTVPARAVEYVSALFRAVSA
jgi:hypothetical protein